MGFRIQNNITAMNAQRNLGISDAAMSKSLERLSSGYRINKAADDAAGLAVSQSFRADIASYKVAQRNVSEANSLIQVAEGSLDQVGNMLTRMKELATQAASANAGTNLDKIDAEYSKLKLEIDRVVNATEYAGTSLLDGTFGATMNGVQGDATADMGFIGSSNVHWAVTGALAAIDATVTAFGSSTPEGTWTVAKAAADGANTFEIGNGAVTEQGTWAAGTISFAGLGLTIQHITANTDIASTNTVVIHKTGLTDLNVSNAAAGTYTVSADAASSITIGNGTITQTVTGFTAGQASQTLNFDKLGVSFTLGTDFDDGDLLNTKFTVSAGAGTGNVFQVGNKDNADNQISFSIASASTDDIGLAADTGLSTASLNASDLSSAANAQDAMTIIDQAIDDVSAIRGGIGANQNRLGYASANLATTLENITAADSVIRDVDMASEMTSFTKNQILVQAGTAMLAQANIASQGVLSLFK